MANATPYILRESEGGALKFIVFITVVFLLITFCFDVQADIIKLTNGKFFVGSATPNEKNAELMDIHFDIGDITVPKSAIANIEEVEVEELTEVSDEDFPEMNFTDSVGLEIKDKKSATQSVPVAQVDEEGRRFFVPKPDAVLPGETKPMRRAPSDSIRVLMARISHVKGDVFFKSPGGDWVLAEEGQTFTPGDSLKTEQGRARLFTRDKLELRFVENTEVTNVAGLTKPTLDLYQGRAWVKVYAEENTKTEKILIRTDSAVAGVQGSLLFVDKPSDGETNVVVFDGHVAVSERHSGDESLSLGSEEAVKITPKGTELTRCDDKMLDEWTFWTINEN